MSVEHLEKDSDAIVQEILRLAKPKLAKTRNDRTMTQQSQEPLTTIVIATLCRPRAIDVLRPVAIEVQQVMKDFEI